MNQVPSRTVRWGIIGLGNIANKFAKDLLSVNGSELYAVASRSHKKASDFTVKYGAHKYYDSYEALSDDENIDAVYIATPHTLHKENTLLCLNKGIAVLCEKPFAMNLTEVTEMISCAKQKNMLLMEALWTRFLPHYQYVEDLLKQKTFGNLLKMEANFGFYRAFDNDSRLFNKSLGGGSLLDIGIYPIFAALTTLGKPVSIDANATFFDNGADSSCNMVFSYENEVKAYLKSSLVEDLPTEAIFYCENATIKINRQFHCPSTVTIITSNNTENKDFNYTTIGYSYEIEHFNNLIRQELLESNDMSFEFSTLLIKTLDRVRDIIKLDYS